MRRKKVFKLNYLHQNSGLKDAHISLLDGPDEVRLGVGADTFLSIRDGIISLGAGTPSTINIQGFSSSMVFAGMVRNQSFPLTLFPSTIASPIPQQAIAPPFLDLIPQLQQLAIAASMMV